MMGKGKKNKKIPMETMPVSLEKGQKRIILFNLLSIVLPCLSLFFIVNSGMILLSFSYSEAFLDSYVYNKVKKDFWRYRGQYDPPEQVKYEQWHFSYRFTHDGKTYRGKTFSYLFYKKLHQEAVNEKETVYFFLPNPELNVFEPGTVGERLLVLLGNTAVCALLFWIVFFLQKQIRILKEEDKKKKR